MDCGQTSGEVLAKEGELDGRVVQEKLPGRKGLWVLQPPQKRKG